MFHTTYHASASWSSKAAQRTLFSAIDPNVARSAPLQAWRACQKRSVTRELTSPGGMPDSSSDRTQDTPRANSSGSGLQRLLPGVTQDATSTKMRLSLMASIRRGCWGSEGALAIRLAPRSRASKRESSSVVPFPLGQSVAPKKKGMLTPSRAHCFRNQNNSGSRFASPPPRPSGPPMSYPARRCGHASFVAMQSSASSMIDRGSWPRMDGHTMRSPQNAGAGSVAWNLATSSSIAWHTWSWSSSGVSDPSR